LFELLAGALPADACTEAALAMRPTIAKILVEKLFICDGFDPPKLASAFQGGQRSVVAAELENTA
ncbi:hypothetical protein N9P58_03620, partial [Puniceicoccaceae bacterium]|nr:hypothetical protein [Puniceicoccaceae bacterium]